MTARLHAIAVARMGAAFAALVRLQTPAAASTALYRTQAIESQVAFATAADVAIEEHALIVA